MKYLVIFFMLFVLTSCVQVEENGVKNEVKKEIVKQNRIKFKVANNIDGQCFVIIEVDGKEYLSQYEGGIIELKKDKNE